MHKVLSKLLLITIIVGLLQPLTTIQKALAGPVNSTSVWEQQAIGLATTDLKGITYSEEKGEYVAVGSEGTILSSVDAVHWKREMSPTIDILNGVTYGQGKFVAVGENGTILTSPNGTTWTKASLGGIAPAFQAVAFGANKFVAVGVDENDSASLFTSNDGLNWDDHSYDLRNDIPPDTMLRGVMFNNNHFTVEGFYAEYTSLDGLNWSDVGGFDGYQGHYLEETEQVLSVGGDLGSGGQLNLSSSYRSTQEPLFGIAFGQSKFVAVGAKGTTVEVGLKKVDSVYDFESDELELPYLQPSTEGSPDLHAVLYANTDARFVTVGDHGYIGIFKAPDVQGVSWTPGDVGGTTKPAALPQGKWKYVVSSTVIARPNQGDSAQGYTQELTALTNISATVGQYIYIVKVDDQNRIMAWAQYTVNETNMNTQYKIKEVATLTPITNLANGTAKTAASLGLPQQVEVTLDDNSKVQVGVNWVLDSSVAYDPASKQEQTFQVIGTLTSLPSNVTNTQNKQATVQITVKAEEIVQHDIKGVAALTSIANVANGTAKTAAALGLPQQVEVTLDDNSKVQVGINWILDSSVSYDPSSKAEQTFQVAGTLTSFPANVTNTQNKQATVQVTVKAEEIVQHEIKEVAALTSITNVANGTAKTAAALGLPQQVEVTLDDNSKVQVGINWVLDSSVSYDPTSKQEQTFQVAGTLTSLPSNVTNTQNKQAAIQVTVKAEEIVQHDIKGVAALTSIANVANGTAKTAAALGLPQQVEVTLDDNSKVQVGVNWVLDPSVAYDPTSKAEQTFQVTGTLTSLPSNVTNTQNKQATLQVTVKAEEFVQHEIKKVATITPITNVANGTVKTAAALGLPQQVEVTLDDNSKVLVGINWILDSSVIYDPTSKQEQTFQVAGTLTSLPLNVTNTQNKQATVQVTVKAAILQADAYITALAVSPGNLKPEFHKGITSYQIQAASDVSQITVTASIYGEGASLSVTGATYTQKTGSLYTITMPLTVGDNFMTLLVIAQDQHTQTVYRLTVHRADVKDELKDVLGHLQIGFASGDSWESVTQSITLPVQIRNTAITWLSSNPQLVSTSGQVTRPTGNDQNLLLTAIANKAGQEERRTFLLIIKKGTVHVVQEETRTASVQVGDGQTAVEQTVITRKTLSDGTKIDKVDMDAVQARTALDQAKAQNKTIIRVVVKEVPGDPANQVAFSLPAEAYAYFANAVDYAIETDEASLVIPKSTLGELNKEGNDLYFHFVPVRSQQEAELVRQQAAANDLVKQQAGTRDVKQVSTPMSIETNYPGNQPAKLMFPISKINVPANTNDLAAYLGSLYFYIEHSDGDKEFKQGTIERDASGTITGLSVTITKFSTFTVLAFDNPSITDPVVTTPHSSPRRSGAGVEVQQPETSKVEPPVSETTSVQHTAYMNGFADNTFRPEQPTTRAELAASIWRLIPADTTVVKQSGYADVDPSHWAYEAITGLTAKGIMSGVGDGKFEQDRPLTRAEFAVLAVRWKKISGATASSFGDTKGHWAEADIAALAASGFVKGYEDGLFHPNSKVTRAEAVTWINRLMNRGPLTGIPAPTWSDVPTTHWAFGDIEEASVNHQATQIPSKGELWKEK